MTDSFEIKIKAKTSVGDVVRIDEDAQGKIGEILKQLAENKTVIPVKQLVSDMIRFASERVEYVIEEVD